MDYPERRVVVTGIGLLAPNGLTVDTFWESLCAGRSGAGPITHFDCSTFPTKIACQLNGYVAENYIDFKKAKRLDRSLQFGIIAARHAVKDCGIDLSIINPGRMGIVEGTSVSGMQHTFDSHRSFIAKGIKGLNTFSLMNAYCGGGSSEIALDLGVPCQALTICTACSSGNDAIGYALNAIRNDDADIMVAGATEAPIVDAYVGTFCASKSLTKRNNEPATSMRPFDRHRDGFLLGEGAAFLVLEELSHALARNARIYAEVLGHGSSSEAYHSVAQHPDGIGIRQAMEKAFYRARLMPSEVDYINAHATATPTNDINETRVIKQVFKDYAKRVQISGTKPVTGHLAGAAAALEAVVCVLSIDRQIIPPTINLTEPDDGCDLDYVPGTARHFPVKTAINLNAGFGGKNSCLIFRAFTG
ncbi:MAG TPA: beta-ketoacyl-[acyl-carrier-protein] synthase family protein [Rariglobus sp.]|jgi:3-oxoacyl-[acyl-carrier-protein] synthase II|nr:beta-ketoacyl-[acyl-carrier-protein] synthase family protein [Rariglobus sp.]